MTDPARNAVSPDEISHADAAKLVFREVPKLDKDGQPTGKMESVALEPHEVLAARDHGDHVVVVTRDGQKFTGQKKAAK